MGFRPFLLGAPASSPAFNKPDAEGGAPCLLKVLQVLREKSAGETPGAPGKGKIYQQNNKTFSYAQTSNK